MDHRDRWQAHVEALEQQTEPLKHQPQALEAQTRTIAWRLLKRFTHGLCTLLAMGLVVGWLTPAAGHTISCGDTLGPGGRFLLEADLDCGTVSPALTVRDGAQLDLGGHTLSSAGFVVLLLLGQRAVVHTGIVEVRVFGTEGIRVTGEGGHTVRQVSISRRTGGPPNIIVTSDHNQLLNNMVSGFFSGTAVSVDGNHNLLTSNWAAATQIGFSISGDHNRLVENTSAPIPPNFPPAHQGFIIEGNKNLLIRNNAMTDTTGFVIGGDGHRLEGNLTFGTSATVGISVSGQDTEIVRNTALNNRIDLVDTHEDCDDNQWQQNVFRTSRAGATENPACIR